MVSAWVGDNPSKLEPTTARPKPPRISELPHGPLRTSPPTIGGHKMLSRGSARQGIRKLFLCDRQAFQDFPDFAVERLVALGRGPIGDDDIGFRGKSEIVFDVVENRRLVFPGRGFRRHLHLLAAFLVRLGIAGRDLDPLLFPVSVVLGQDRRELIGLVGFDPEIDFLVRADCLDAARDLRSLPSIWNVEGRDGRLRTDFRRFREGERRGGEENSKGEEGSHTGPRGKERANRRALYSLITRAQSWLCKRGLN